MRAFKRWGILLLILLVGVGGMGARIYAQATLINISASGFTPSVLTISVGSTVTWQNSTFDTYTLQSGSPNELLLPIMRLPTGAGRQASGAVIDPFIATLPPGGSFSHQFTSAGEIFFHLNERPEVVGRIVILPLSGTSTATSVATTVATATATQVGNATATPTSAATETFTVTPTQPGNATPTPTSAATATFTATPTQPGNATATPTSAATETFTATPTQPSEATATPTPLETSTPTPTPAATEIPLLAAWMLNTTGELSAHIGGGTIPVNVQSAQKSTDVVTVQTGGIPNYAHTVTQGDVTIIQSRPKYSTGDFRTSQGLLVGVGEIVDFGQDIGYSTNAGPNNTCDPNQGYGYWPRGPSCPTQQTYSLDFPLAPQPATQEADICEVGMGTIGFWVNGTGIFNWADGQSYNGARVWNNAAPVFEQYDMDICWGHANQDGEYHHHAHPTCLAEQLNDDGTGHSPIYGFMADGYPLYGPWHAQDQLAQSCWMTRDYSDTSATGTGCSVANKRTCLLVDQYDISKGKTTASSAGPDIGASVSSQSGNPISAVSGVYYEDYYYDASCAAQGGAYLDDHNGHDHDGLGYHYHVTATPANNDVLIGVFPYMVGPTFYGKVPNNTVTSCGGGPPPPPLLFGRLSQFYVGVTALK